MKKCTSKWKSLNQKGLKLSLICSLNWLISFVAKSQFYLFSAGFLGLLTYFLPQDYRVVTVGLVMYFLGAKAVLNFGYGTWLQDFRRIKLSLKEFIFLLFFIAGTEYTTHHAISEQMVNNLCKFLIISAVFASLANIFILKLFKYYVLKNIIDKKYLGIRKLTDDLPPEINFYNDVDEADADKRMRQINKNAIKQPYQDVVELSFLNREVITAIGYKAASFGKETERTFVDDDTIYYPIFTVHPFGILEGELGFYHELIKLKLSRKAAFTVKVKAY